MKEIDLRAGFNLNIVAVESTDMIIDVVSFDYIFKKNDILFLSGENEAFEGFSDWTNK